MKPGVKPKEGYARYAPQYDEKEKFWDSFEKNSLAPWIKQAHGKTVLDAGAGTGRISARLVAAGADVTALDISPEMLAVLHKKNGHVHPVVGDVEAMPFPDESFDMVFSNLVLVHLKKIEPFLEECYRVLKDDGHLVLTNIHYRKAMVLKDDQGQYVIEGYNHFPRHVREAAEEMAFGVVDEIMVYEGDEVWVSQVLVLKK